jgi:hypothetical protein
MPPSLLTIKYLEKLADEIDVRDYESWLARKRQQEAAGQRPLLPARKSVTRLRTRQTRPQPKGADQQVRRTEAGPNSAADALRVGLSKVCDVWEQISEDRSRDSIFDYLKAVYALVRRSRRKGVATKLRQRAVQFADLSYDENAEIFSVVIRSTCDGKLDNKTVSKLSRALRYAAHRDRPPRLLIQFMKRLGGINACASRFAKTLGRAAQSKA